MVLPALESLFVILGRKTAVTPAFGSSLRVGFLFLGYAWFIFAVLSSVRISCKISACCFAIRCTLIFINTLLLFRRP
jgi:hypothetical protein